MTKPLFEAPLGVKCQRLMKYEQFSVVGPKVLRRHTCSVLNDSDGRGKRCITVFISDHPPLAPFHRNTEATEVGPPHWSHPGKLWSDLRLHERTSTLPWDCRENSGKGFYTHLVSISAQNDHPSVAVWTWCIPPCCPLWLEHWHHQVWGHEKWSSPGSPCPPKSTSPDHIPQCCCPWEDMRV